VVLVSEPAGEWIEATRAAERLGVKPATLYAYVSRGVLRRRRAADGRRSLFDPAEIEDLARRGRPRRPPGSHELVIESQVTMLGDDRPYYRGRDAIGLAESHDFEDVAYLLWTGEPAAEGPWRARPEAVTAARAAQSGLPAATLPLERLQVITVVLATADPLRLTRDPDAVTAAGRNLIAGMVDALPAADPGAAAWPGPSSIAERLWTRLTPAEPRPEQVGALRAALVLLADHELAASTLAARVAASVRADPYAVVAAGLGVLGGALHGGASLGAEALFAEVGEPGQAGRVIGERLRRGERIPGFGHGFHQAVDGRGAYLLDRIRAGAPDDDRLAVVEAVLADARGRRLPTMNADLALAALATVFGMTRGAGEAIFAVARTAGWLAHALEEYARDTPMRPRAVYTGRPPESRPRS
jgi:citrate synthase